MPAASEVKYRGKEEGRQMKLLYGTGNEAKLEAMRHRLDSLGMDLEVLGLKDLGTEIPRIPEDGATPLENAERKARGYYEAFHIPVFSCDSGLYIDGLPESLQPGVHVRTVNGKTLSDGEMLAYYSGLAAKYGNLTARYRNAICFVKDSSHIYRAMEKSMESEPFLITARPHAYGILKEGFPLDSISLHKKTGKYYYDLEDGELDVLAVEDGFLDFFRKYL